VRKIVAWLEREVSGPYVPLFIVAALACCYLYLVGLGIFVDAFNIVLPKGPKLPTNSPFPILIIVLALGAWVEEVIFRLGPIWVARRLFHASTRSTVVVILIVSACFGYIHAGGHAWFIAIQGVLGVMLSVVFMKCGGLQGRYAKALIASTATHTVHNTIVTLIIVLSR